MLPPSSDWPADLQRRLDTWAAQHQVQGRLLDRWRALPAADAEPLVSLAEDLRPSENQMRDFFEWIEEIAWRDGAAIAAVLDGEALVAARSAVGGRNDRVRAVREAFRRLRFPQLVAAEERLASCTRALSLPPGARLLLPANLSDTEVRLEIRAADATHLRRALEAAGAALARPALDEVFDVLNGLPAADGQR